MPPTMKKTQKKTKADFANIQSAALIDRWHLAVVLGLCVLGFLIYANTLASSFHWDDYAVIINNSAIRQWMNFGEIFNAFNTRFLVGLSFAINYALGQLNAGGYHFFNIWLHLCNTVLVYALTLLILSDDSSRSFLNRFRISIFSAAIFLVHPLNTQAVNYIWQRSTLMVTFFSLLTICLLILYRKTHQWWAYSASIFACLLAMLCKENAFVLPFLLLVVDAIVNRHKSQSNRARFLQFLPFLLCMPLIPLLLQRSKEISLEMMRPYSVFRGVSPDVISSMDYWLAQVNVLCTYLRMVVFPFGLNVDHDYPLVSQSGWFHFLVSLTILIGFMSLGIYFLRRQRILFLAIMWFLIAVSLESIVVSKDLCVEHRMYLPMVGLCWLFAISFFDRFEKHWRAGAAFACVIIVLLSGVTVNRNRVWKDEFSLWNDAAEKSSQKARPLNNRGRIFRQVGQTQLALNDFNRAIALDPTFTAAYQNRAHIFKSDQQWDLAIKDYTSVIALEPYNPESYASRGGIYKRRGGFEQALSDYTFAIQYAPSNPEYYTHRAYVYQQQNRFDEALSDYATAIMLAPHYVYALNNRGNCYLKMGQIQNAINDYNRVLAIDPKFAESYLNRAVANFQLKNFGEVQSDIDAARKFGVEPHVDFIKQFKELRNEKNIRERS